MRSNSPQCSSSAFTLRIRYGKRGPQDSLVTWALDAMEKYPALGISTRPSTQSRWVGCNSRLRSDKASNGRHASSSGHPFIGRQPGNRFWSRTLGFCRCGESAGYDTARGNDRKEKKNPNRIHHSEAGLAHAIDRRRHDISDEQTTPCGVTPKSRDGTAITVNQYECDEDDAYPAKLK